MPGCDEWDAVVVRTQLARARAEDLCRVAKECCDTAETLRAERRSILTRDAGSASWSPEAIVGSTHHVHVDTETER
jgi:hypothetical protein